jgi:hypothetical protein
MGRSSHVSFARAVPIALLLALTAPAVAHADAELSVSGTAPTKVLTFTVHDVRDHVTNAIVQNGRLVVGDNVGVTVGASGCASIDPRRVDCGLAAELSEVVFIFGDGSDRLNNDASLTVPRLPIAMSAYGGGGSDVLIGGLLDDALYGGAGDDVVDGGDGDDDLFGEDGNDWIMGGSGVDILDGGAGDDGVWAAETPPEADYDVACGPGVDVLWDSSDGDPLADDCEIVDKPTLDGELRITGEAREGSVLALSLPRNVGGDGVETVQWERCDSAGDGCDPMSVGPTYTPVHADVGHRLRAWYRVENPLGEDWVESDATPVVVARPPIPRPPTSRPPRPTVPRPPRATTPPFLLIAPLAVTRKPSFVIRDGDPMVDTGRDVTCPGVAGSAPCRLKVATVPTRGTAHVHGRPSSLGQGSVLVAAAAHARVRVPLNVRAYRLLRARRKLTMLVTVTVTRPYSQSVRTTFEITVKLREA